MHVCAEAQINPVGNYGLPVPRKLGKWMMRKWMMTIECVPLKCVPSKTGKMMIRTECLPPKVLSQHSRLLEACMCLEGLESGDDNRVCALEVLHQPQEVTASLPMPRHLVPLKLGT